MKSEIRRDRQGVGRVNTSLLKLAGLSGIALVAATAPAQNWNAFWQAQTISGVSMSYNLLTKELTASISPGAKVKIAGVEREIENFFGFYVLTLNPPEGDPPGPLGATNQQSPSGWTFEDDQQWLAGWENNPKNNLGSPKTGQFATLNFQHVGWWGMHVRYMGSDDTQYIRWNGSTPPSNVVPEPFTMGLGIAGAAAFARRKYRSKKG